MMRFLRLPAVLAVVVVLAACGSARPSKYYTLEVPAASPVAGAPLPVDVVVGRLGAPQILRDERIVYRAAGSQLGSYEYHRWAEPPALMIEELLLDSLRDSGRFRSVQPQKSNTRGDYVVRGYLHEFGEVTGSPLVARIKLELLAYDSANEKLLYSRTFSQDEPVNGKEVSSVVAALNQGVHQALADFTASFADFCAKNPKK